MMLTCSGGRSSPRLSRSLLPPHSSPVLGLNATPTVFRRPRAKIRPPEPSGLNCETAARSEITPSPTMAHHPPPRTNLPPGAQRITLIAQVARRSHREIQLAVGAEQNRARGVTATGNVVQLVQ